MTAVEQGAFSEPTGVPHARPDAGFMSPGPGRPPLNREATA